MWTRCFIEVSKWILAAAGNSSPLCIEPCRWLLENLKRPEIYQKSIKIVSRSSSETKSNRKRNGRGSGLELESVFGATMEPKTSKEVPKMSLKSQKKSKHKYASNKYWTRIPKRLKNDIKMPSKMKHKFSCLRYGSSAHFWRMSWTKC